MSRRSPSADEVKLCSSFELLRKTLLADQLDDRLDKPLAFWARNNDRRLPLALLDRSLREVLATPYAELIRTPGIGQKKTETLVRLLRRASSVPSPGLPEFTGEQPTKEVASNGHPPTFDAGNVCDQQWTSWVAKVRRYGLGDVPLGRLAPTLKGLPTVIWDTPLATYYDCNLTELRQLKNHGAKRIQSVLQVFHLLDEMLGSGNDPAFQQFTAYVVPRFVQPIESWIHNCGDCDECPPLEDMAAHMVRPMIEQIRHDAGPQIAELAVARLGIHDEPKSVQRLADQSGFTRARIYQLFDQCADVMNVRWPDGGDMLRAFWSRIAMGDPHRTDRQSLDLLKRTTDLFYPKNSDETVRARSNGHVAVH